MSQQILDMATQIAPVRSPLRTLPTLPRSSRLSGVSGNVPDNSEVNTLFAGNTPFPGAEPSSLELARPGTRFSAVQYSPEPGVVETDVAVAGTPRRLTSLRAISPERESVLRQNLARASSPMRMPSPQRMSSPVRDYATSRVADFSRLRQSVMSKKYDSISEALNAENAENILEDHQYKVIKRVHVQNDDGLHTRYIISFNPLGEIVAILVDTQGYAPVVTGDSIVVEKAELMPTADGLAVSVTSSVINPASIQSSVSAAVSQFRESIPQSIKDLASKISSRNSGALIVCDNGYCVSSQEDNGDSSLSFFAEKEAQTLSDVVATHPIIRMSEIVQNPSEVLQMSHQEIKRIQNTIFQAQEADLYKLATQDSYELKSAAQQFENAVRVYLHEFRRITEELKMSMAKLEQFVVYGLRNKPQCESEQKKLEGQQYNLRKRNMILSKLHAVTQDVEFPCVLGNCDIVTALNEKTASIKANTVKLQQKYSVGDYDIRSLPIWQEKESKKCWKAQSDKLNKSW